VLSCCLTDDHTALSARCHQHGHPPQRLPAQNTPSQSGTIFNNRLPYMPDPTWTTTNPPVSPSDAPA
jgi:hypothetical protein